MKNIKHDELFVEVHQSERKISVGKELEISVNISKKVGSIETIHVLLNQWGEEPSIIRELKEDTNEEEFKTYSTKVLFNRVGTYFFFFYLVIDGVERTIKISRETGEACITNGEGPYWEVLVHNEFTIPKWAKGKLIYQIFVDRFYKSPNAVVEKQIGREHRMWGAEVNWQRDMLGNFHNNDFFGGNLKGIEEKLEYLASLGIEILYLSPINWSGRRYDRYAATSHMEIDPEVGTFKDLESLHNKALSLGIHIILDVAFNHCCSDNQIFLDAQNNPNSAFKDWFERDEHGRIRYWYGFSDMPEFNQLNKEYRNYIFGEDSVVAKFSKYVDGFRLDLAECLEPTFLEGIRKRANVEKQHFIVGECWNEVDISILGKGLDAPTYYPLTNAVLKFLAYGESEYLDVKVRQVSEDYPQEVCDALLVSLDTHDIIRVLTILAKNRYMRRGECDIWKIDEPPTPWHRDGTFYTDEFRGFEYENDKLDDGEYNYAKNLLKVGAILQYFLLGNPCVFYGTEAGLYGWKDPFNRRCYPWGSEDKDLLEHYQKLGQFRKKFVLENCNPQVLYRDSEVFIFKRENEENSVFVAINRGNRGREIKVPEEFQKASENKENVFILNGTTNYLLPYGGIVIYKAMRERS